jgi:exonuclease III
MQELAEQISKTQLEILAIQEIRWSGTGLIKKQNYSLYYCGPSSKTGQASTGFILLKKMHHSVIGFEPYNERLCKLRIKGKYNNITLIKVYAPTEDHTEETKQQFYDNLQNLLDKTPKSDTIIILGDVNAQLGKERLYNEVTGQHTLHEETNRNGELLCEFAYANNMVVMCTNFQHKITWLSPDQNTASQRDHIIINANKKGVIEDVKSKSP